MIMPDTKTLIDTTTMVSQQSDRWMFVAMLIIFIVAGAWMTKYFTTQLERARGEFQTLSKEFHTFLSDANKELGQLLARNTEALNKVEKKLQ